MKYGTADKVTVQLTRDEEELTLLIEDNGDGFDPEILAKGKGNGWKNINTRVNLIQGELHLDTLDGRRGTTLIITTPESQIRRLESQSLAEDPSKA